MNLIEKRLVGTWVTYAFCAAAVLVGTRATVLAQAPATPGQFEACIRQKADEEAFSGVVSAVERGRSLATVARGELAGQLSPPITPTSRFNIGSASKMFTAVAIGQLIDAGKVRLDDTVGKYVAGLTPEGDAVTIRQLLTHTAGLSNFFNPDNFEAIEKARSASDLLPMIAHEKPKFTPGDHFEYSNSGFALLGIVIERVSGHDYGHYLLQHVFGPAGMTNSGVDPEPIASLAIGMTSIDPGTASLPGGGAPSGSPILVAPDPGAGSERGRIAPAMPVMGHGEHTAPAAAGAPLHPAPGAAVHGTSAGGVFSTAVDLQKFMAALLANQLTKPETTVALTTLKVTPRGNPPGSGYGYGFGIRQDRGRQWVGHSGGTLGANSEIFVDTSSGVSVAVITNRDPPSATRMFSYIKDLLAESTISETCDSTVTAPGGAMIMEGSAPPPHAVTGDETTLPITMLSGLPTIKVAINGKGPFMLALDTGAPGGPHLTSRLAGFLGLAASSEMTVSDPSARNPMRATAYPLESVEFGAVTARGWMSSVDGMRPKKNDAVDGVVGLDAFAGYIAAIDYPNGSFRLRRGALPAADGKSIFSYKGQMAPTVPLRLEGRIIAAHIDTGNTVAGIIVPDDFALGMKRKSEAKRSGTAQTIGNTVRMFSVPIYGVARVGEVRLTASSVGFPSIIPIANIGSPALSKIVVEVDPANQRVRLSSVER